MKRYALFCAVAGMLALSLSCAGVPTAQPPDPPYAFARGWANLMGGWLEIPRGIIYENTRIPLVGFAAGPVKGVFLALWRTLAGGMDVVCFGVTRQGLYTRDVPEFVWDAQWIPVCEGAHAMDDGEASVCRGARAARGSSAQQRAAAITVTGTVCTLSNAPRPQGMPSSRSGARTPSRVQDDPFAVSSDEALDARIQAIEQSVRDIERRAAIFE